MMPVRSSWQKHTVLHLTMQTWRPSIVDSIELSSTLQYVSVKAVVHRSILLSSVDSIVWRLYALYDRSLGTHGTRDCRDQEHVTMPEDTNLDDTNIKATDFSNQSYRFKRFRLRRVSLRTWFLNIFVYTGVSCYTHVLLMASAYDWRMLDVLNTISAKHSPGNIGKSLFKMIL